MWSAVEPFGPGVAGRGESRVEAELDQGQRQVEVADAGERVVDRAVVDDDDAGELEAGAVDGHDRLEAPPELRAGVPVDDDDVEAGRRSHSREHRRPRCDVEA